MPSLHPAEAVRILLRSKLTKVQRRLFSRQKLSEMRKNPDYLARQNEQSISSKWRQTSLKHLQESIRLGGDLEKAREALSSSQGRLNDLQKQLSRCICTAG